MKTGTGSSCTTPTTFGTYAYDGTGLRMSKTAGGTTTKFVWDEPGSLPLLLEEAVGSATTDYVYGPGGLPVEQITSTAATPPSISQVGTAVTASDATGAGGTISLTLPSGIQAGDQIIVSTTYPAGVSNSTTTPTGYTQLGSTVNSGGTAATADVTQIFRKQATGGETSASISYSANTFSRAATAVVYRGVDASSPVDVNTTGTNSSGTAVSVSGTTGNTNERLLVIQGASYTSTGAAGAWSASSPLVQRGQRDTGTVTIGVADAGQASAASTGTLTSTFTVSGTALIGPQLTAVLLGLRPQSKFFYHHDQVGSARVLTDGLGNAVWTATFDSYGNVVSSTNSGNVINPLVWAGQYRDAESGLYYLRARYYDPSTAQFLSRDPAVAVTREPYGYVHGNPLNATDPTGLCGLWGNDTCLSHVTSAASSAWHATTSQVTSWAGDINHFINDNQFGWCVDGSVGTPVVAVAGSACVTFNAHSFGVTGTFGHGWEAPGGASLTIGPMFAAGAHDPSDLGGHFSYTGVSAGELFPVGGMDSASGYGSCGQQVTQYNPSVGVGVNLPWPASVHQGDSYTWVWMP